jgi:hypothetical protein
MLGCLAKLFIHLWRINEGNTILLTTVLKGWREMKKWLLVLLVLGLAVPAIADVFVYNFKLGGVYFEQDDEGNWVRSKPEGDTLYFVIQVDSNSPDSVNIRVIDTWKEKDDEGVMHKYYTIDGPYTISFLQTLIARKNTWIIEGTTSDEDNTRIMVSGQAKLKKIGTPTYTVAATLTGYLIYGNIESQEVGGHTVSLKLNSKITTALVSSDADVTGAIDAYFGEDGLGYEPGPD